MFYMVINFKVMVATVRCEEIASEVFSNFTANEVSFILIYAFVLITYMLCAFGAIANQLFVFVALNFQEWRALDEAVQSGPVSGFGKKLTSIIGVCLSG